jgi:HAMP domain-containing protein
MIMRLTERHLRRIIRAAIQEQVVGYNAPAKSYDDPEGDDPPSSPGKDPTGSDDQGYLSVGSMGVDTPLHGSTDEQQASAQQVQTLTQQRQKALDKGDTVGAEDAGKQLSIGRRMRG